MFDLIQHKIPENNISYRNINKTNNNLSPKEGLNSDVKQFHQYQ